MSDQAKLSPSTRRRIETAIEKLIAALDACDPDPDIEDGFDLEEDPAEGGLGDMDGVNEQHIGEPTLGGTANFDQRLWAAGSNDDCEQEHDA